MDPLGKLEERKHTIMIEVTYSTKIDMLRAGKQIVKYNSNCSVPPSEELDSHPSHLIMRVLMQHHQWTANGTFGPVSKWVFFFFFYRSQLMQLYIPQPMDPQLSTWAITGMLERLNSFRGKRQLSG